MAVSLMTAKSVKNTQNPESGGGVGRSGSKFVIKVGQYALRGNAQLEDVQGDGDPAGGAWEEGEVREAITLRGWLVAGSAIGLQNLGDSEATVSLLLSANRKFSGTLKIRRYDINWRRAQGAIPLSLSGRFEGRVTEAAVT